MAKEKNPYRPGSMGSKIWEQSRTWFRVAAAVEFVVLLLFTVIPTDAQQQFLKTSTIWQVVGVLLMLAQIWYLFKYALHVSENTRLSGVTHAIILVAALAFSLFVLINGDSIV